MSAPRPTNPPGLERYYVLTKGRSGPGGSASSLDVATLIVLRTAPVTGMQHEHEDILRRCRDPLSVAELGAHLGVVSHLRLVLIAAHTTTSNLLARVLQLILTDTSWLSGLVSGELNISAVAQEVMWNTPPLAVLPGRFATADLELGGHHVQEGDLLVLGLAAGNVDPEVRPDSEVSVEGNDSHLAFSSGPHECPGQSIGMSIIEIAVDVLLHRLPGLRLAVPAEDLTSTASTWESRLDSLPVEFPV